MTPAIYVMCSIQTHTHTHTHIHSVCTIFLQVNRSKHSNDANFWGCIQRSRKSSKAQIPGNDRNKPKFACTKQLRAGWIQGTPAALLPGHFVFHFAIFRPYSLTQAYTCVLFVWYECETWYFTTRKERRLRVFENRVLRRIFGPMKDEVTGEWRKLHNEELRDLYFSPYIT